MSQTITPDITLTYTRIVERYAHFFDKPEIRLRYLNKTLTKHISSCEKLKESVERFKFIERSKFYKLILDWWLYVLIIREVKQFSRSEGKGFGKRSLFNNVPFGSLVLFHLYQLRYAVGAMGILASMVVTIGLCSLVLDSTQRPTNTSLAMRNDGQTLNRTDSSTGLVPVKYLPDYKPVKVWLVEEHGDFERFSNGLRIQKGYETANHQRAYNLFQPDGAKISQTLYHDPVGIVYHTSESELIPFNSENNNSIESHSSGLLNYVQTHKSYNYLIDRFGQVYRIVRDDQAANHAGNSVWADQKALYVGLNESFLGVCFETRSEANHEEQLTEAQLLAGRLLTQVLRSRYNIDDANCITHGLVSINPKQMVIAYHHDWVKNFPFEALGLSDKYKVPTTSISIYGFTYDDNVVAYAGGEIWPGAKLAEEEFRSRAARAQIDVTDLRRQMRDLYRTELAEQNAARRLSGEEDKGTKGDGLSNESNLPFDSELAGNDG